MMDVLGMFARRPEPGRVKTRLAADIGDDAACVLYTCFLKDMLERFQTTGDKRLLCVTPDNSESRNWFRQTAPAEWQILLQQGRGLGDRIEWFFRQAVFAGAGRMVLTGSDSPDLPTQLIASAFAALASVDVVLGPSADGGFTLIGSRIPLDDVLTEVRWSSDTTLTETLRAVERAGGSVALTEPWYDIDTIEDLKRLDRTIRDRSDQSQCHRTAAWISEHWESCFLRS